MDRHLFIIFFLSAPPFAFCQCPVTLLWKYETDNPTKKFSRLEAIALDQKSNVYLAGYTKDENGEAKNQRSDSFINKYGPDGKFLWQTFFSGHDHLSARVNQMAIDPNGNVVAVGQMNEKILSNFKIPRRD